MPLCAEQHRVLRPKFTETRSKNAIGLNLRRRTLKVEGKPSLRQGRRKTLNPVKTNLNIHERPVRKKKKTPKYETYERDRGISLTPAADQGPHAETNVLLALGLRPVPNGLTKMLVVESDPPKSAVAADSPDKSVSAVTTTVKEEEVAPAADDVITVTSQVNGVCDSAGEGKRRGSKGSAGSPSTPDNDRRTPPDLGVKKEMVSPSLIVKKEPTGVREGKEVEGGEPQDLTVTCTSSIETLPRTFPSAKYISISVEQCQASTSSRQPQINPQRKRSAKSSDSDESNNKRGKMDEREAAVSMYVEQASSGTMDDLQRHADHIQQEIHGLSALARTKEYEWNEVIRNKKMKEEIYLRLIRQKQIMMMMMSSGSRPPDDPGWDFSVENRLADLVTNDQVSLNKVKRLPSNLTITKSAQSGASQQLQRFLMQSQQRGQHAEQPIGNGSPQRNRSTSSKGQRMPPCPILPKPSQANLELQSSAARQGQPPVVDVKSIIADYRQSHPGEIPRRGRRMKGTAENAVSSSRGVLNMSSYALGSGSQVRTVGSTSGPEETSRPSSADSSRSDALNLKDVYVQYGKLHNNSSKAPPPYPEVTLHPVVAGGSQSPPPTSSLLHGILTKQGPAGVATTGAGVATPGTGGKTFSPTLARLLTTPDRPSTTTTITTAVRGSGTSVSSAGSVSITELLSTSKTRNELTITPVVSNAQPAKREEPVSASQGDEDAEEPDRLVIDEGEDTENDPPEVTPECQGCHLKPSKFVCAGCANQWYCSRNCQVHAWDEHSEVCIG